MSSLGFTGRLSAWSARHHWLVIAGWLVGAVVITALAGVTGSRLTTDISFSNAPESQVARELLQDARGAEPFFEQVIVESDRYTVDDPEYAAFVNELANAIRAESAAVDPQQVFSYFDIGEPSLVSADGRTTIVPALLRGELDEATQNVVVLEEVLDGFDGRDGFHVLTGGFASINNAFTHQSEADLAAEFKMLPVALIVLLLVFGAVVAALLPMILAFFGIGITFGLVALATQVYEMSFFVTNVMTVIGLAVGIDYALFVIARYREQRRQGEDHYEAIGVAGDTAARAVFFSGITVVIALMGMFVVPTSIFRSFAIGASLVVLVTIVASITLLPAALSLLGNRINSLSIPFIGGSTEKSDERGFWASAARAVMARPLPMALGASALLIVMSIPYFSISLGASGTSALPESVEARQAFDILDREFSAGRLQPTDIVIQSDQIDSPEVQRAIEALVASLVAVDELRAGEDTFTLVSPPQVPVGADGSSGRDDLIHIGVAVPGDNTSDEAIEAMKFLRSDLVPAAFNGVTVDVYVGGPTAGNSDFFDQVGEYTPLVFAFVLGFSFILLTLIFRSLVVPVKSIIMNLLSVGAAYGVVVAVFQWGWGADVLGFTQVDHIEAWLPLFMFTILFGLSMDYHIFLLSRIRERFDETHDNAGSVAFGLRRTANLITGAAAIMVAVFGGFALGELPMFQQIGLGLAVSVFLDATIVRTILVPSTMRLLGDLNWYMPSWLNWLPDLRVEREPAPAVSTDTAEADRAPVGIAGGH